jgi:hypothetical protein
MRKQFEFEIQRNNTTASIRVFAKDLESAKDLVCKIENCPRSAIVSVVCVPTKKQLAKTKRLMQGL